MALSKRLLFIIGSFFVLFLFSCAETSSDPDPEEPATPSSVNMISPSAENTYWSDQAVSCEVGLTNVDESDIDWLVGDQVVACTDGTLNIQLAEGEYTVTVRASAGGDSVQDTADITVKEGFSVTLNEPADASSFFVGDQLTCDATVSPEKYADALEITVGGMSCTGNSVELTEAGDLSVVASLTVDDRTETDAAAVVANPAISGTVYPLTDRGVSSNASGFSVTLTTSGGVLHAETASDGSFAFPNAPRDIYDTDESITMEIAAKGDFYGARAELETYTPWTPDNDGEPISAGRQFRDITSADSLGFVLAPRDWRIRCGPFSGQSTTIKLPEAFKRYDSERQYSSFYMYFSVFGESMYRKLLPEDRPLPIAFDREESTVSITAADSTTFWEQTEAVEEKICRGDLFAPATIDEVPTIDDGVLVMALSSDGFASGGAVTNDYGHITGGTLHLPIDDFGNSDTQAHELNQILGFGETSEWAGIMASNGGFSNTTRYSTNDIAHIQLYMDAVDVQAEEKVSFGVYSWRRMFDIPSLPDN